MAPEPIKNLGRLSFGLALDALGVALVMVENPDQIRRVQNRWDTARAAEPTSRQTSPAAAAEGLMRWSEQRR